LDGRLKRILEETGKEVKTWTGCLYRLKITVLIKNNENLIERSTFTILHVNTGDQFT
jgi:hypothetical protein